MWGSGKYISVSTCLTGIRDRNKTPVCCVVYVYSIFTNSSNIKLLVHNFWKMSGYEASCLEVQVHGLVTILNIS